ncbi:hypothetical protein [Phycicoccus sonneratiae]|uniref:Uncharacterized protein n=1 Tax=Phycicoccus sonneratiae TaxID=2807628 RepID=A0ABS2CR56_9MICO|nr:hypothetical protein [Phycicoccus sonneraticus]MBM6402315.1 hypothetical protein [Phycicoccus sonneraticus]
MSDELTDLLERVIAPPMALDADAVLAGGRRRRLRHRLRRGGAAALVAAVAVPVLTAPWPRSVFAPSPARTGQTDCRLADLAPGGTPPNAENGVDVGGTPWLDSGPPTGDRSVRVQVHTDTCEGLAVAVSRGGGRTVSAAVTTTPLTGRPDAAFWVGGVDGSPLDRLGNPTPVTVDVVVLLPEGQRVCGVTLEADAEPVELAKTSTVAAGAGWSATFGVVTGAADLAGATLRICSGKRTVDAALPQLAAAADTVPAVPVPTTATVDEATGTIALPYDAYWPTQAESEDIVSAARVAMIHCQQARGVTPADPLRRVIPDPPPRRFGVWRMADATRYGYLEYTSSAKAAALADRSTTDPQLAARQAAAAAACAREDPVLRQLNRQPDEGAWSTEIPAAETRAEQSAPYRQAIEDWARCMQARGLTTEPGSLVPAGIDTGALDEGRVESGDVAIAVADVTCKQQTHTVQRLADLLAAAQAPLVVEYQGPLRKQRALVDAELVLARQVLRDAGL